MPAGYMRKRHQLLCKTGGIHKTLTRSDPECNMQEASWSKSESLRVAGAIISKGCSNWHPTHSAVHLNHDDVTSGSTCLPQKKTEIDSHQG